MTSNLRLMPARPVGVGPSAAGRVTVGRVTVGRVTVGRVTVGHVTVGHVTVGPPAITALCIAVLCVAMLGGCAVGAGSSDPGATTTVQTTPMSTEASPSSSPEDPSSSPSPSPGADCAADGIVPGRLGCLDTNAPVAGNPGEALVAWEADFCAPGDGRFVYTAAPALVALEGHTGAAIGRIDVYDPTLMTAEGIHVGSTKADVTAAYPSTPSETSGSGTELVVIDGPDGFITIELADGWGTEPWTVANIRIYAIDRDPHVRVYGTEDFAGACPFDL